MQVQIVKRAHCFWEQSRELCMVWNGQVKLAIASGLEAVYRQLTGHHDDAATVRQVVLE